MIISDGPDTAYEWLKHIRGTTALMRVVQFPFANAIFAVKGCLQVCFTIVGCATPWNIQRANNFRPWPLS
jgi:hypothetical protein